jgi:type II restriction enzyme
MNLNLDPGPGSGYSSASQWARRVTEGWALQNLYCVACASESLSAHVANRAVEDYHCPRCRRNVQLKAKQGRLGQTVSNSAYAKKEAAIAAGRAPDYCFMSYNRDSLTVSDVLWVPGHFITLSVVSARTPLRATAERAGWIGSNIHLGLVPVDGKIPLVADGVVVSRLAARRQFRKLAFAQSLDSAHRGWLLDVLACLDSLELTAGKQFTNGDIYACEANLSRLHPRNQNIQAKIRQQLQVLTAHGIVERISPGRYQRL